MGCFDFVLKWFEFEVKFKEKNIFLGFGEDNVLVVNLGSYGLLDLSIKGDFDVLLLLEFVFINFLGN